MDVTAENFSALLPVIKQQIEGAAFIAIDEEMTGIQDRLSKISADDSPSQRYLKMIAAATKYAIIQFGVSLFHRNEADNGYVAYTYNFYLFPSSGADLILSADAITFLRNNGMDFGKWMTSGISFADSRRMEWLHKRLGDSLAVKTVEDDGKGMVLNREADLAFAKRNLDGLDSFLGNGELTEYIFEDTNAYLRRFLYDTVERKYPSLTMKKNGEGKLCACKLDETASKEHKDKVEAEARAKFESDAGFRLVFDCLVAARKPLIGHNLFFDLLFMLRWLDGPLDASFADLKDRLDKLFPVIYDTKYLAASGILGDELTSASTTLSDVYKLFVEGAANPGIVYEDIKTAEGFPRFLDPLADGAAAQFHNAGYDAFCTGCVFAREASTLDSRGALGWKESANKMLFMMRSLYHMSLAPGESDGVLKVEGMIYNVTGFAKEVKNDDILAVFTKAFSCEPTALNIIWVDNNSFFVAVALEAVALLCESNGVSDSSSEEAVQLCAQKIAEQTTPIYEKAKAAAEEAEMAGAASNTVRPWAVMPFAEYLASKSEPKRALEEGAATPAAKRARTEDMSVPALPT